MAEKCLVSARDIDVMAETEFVHPLNGNAVRKTRTLGDLAGLKNLGVHLVRVEPGHETTEFHFHHAEDEFVYILSGRGLAEIDGEHIEVGPGDFIGFPAGGPPHDMRNPGPEDLIYLMVGERHFGDVVDYPRKGKRLLKAGGHRKIIDLE